MLDNLVTPFLEEMVKNEYNFALVLGFVFMIFAAWFSTVLSVIHFLFGNQRTLATGCRDYMYLTLLGLIIGSVFLSAKLSPIDIEVNAKVVFKAIEHHRVQTYDFWLDNSKVVLTAKDEAGETHEIIISRETYNSLLDAREKFEMSDSENDLDNIVGGEGHVK